MAERVLVVEDEADIQNLLAHVFRREGFDVVTAEDGQDALAKVRSERPDLVLLDLMLPRVPGIEVLKKVKSEAETRGLPVILLTARGEEIDRVLGFELGADDYVTKPFSPREVVLRARAVLRRAKLEENSQASVLRFGPISLDLDDHRVSVSGVPLDLTITEFRLLADLVKARGRVRSREVLLREVWGYDSEVLSRTVDTHMRRLRSKLGPAAERLGTVRGVGYRVHDPSVES